MGKTAVNRRYKDSLFRSIFGTKEELLSLYNAMNSSSYTDASQLIITTIEDVIYMEMKNDVSFVLSDYLNLYETQSSWNPNMPLRGLGYFSRLYEGYVESHRLDKYSKVRLTLPAPKYVVFYNGPGEMEDVEFLRLSDSYGEKGQEEPAVECVATVVNINFGRNKELMEKCRPLYEYSRFVHEVRKCRAGGCELREAVDGAVNVCIGEGILEEFLRKRRAEVLGMFLAEYDKELHIRSEKELSYREGRREGAAAKLLRQIIKKVNKGKTWEIIAEELEEDPERIRRICECIKDGDLGESCGKLYEELVKQGIF